MSHPTVPAQSAPAQSVPTPSFPTPSPRLSPLTVLAQTMTMAHRALIKLRRNPEQLFDVVFGPLLFTFMFGNIFGGAMFGSVAAALPTLVPGILAQTVLTSCVTSGVNLRTDMDKGVFDRFRALPMSRIAPLAGPMVADITRYVIAAALTFLVGVIMGYRPGGGVLGVVLATAMAALAGWSLAWVFTLVGVLSRNARAVQGFSLMIMFPLTFLSNAFAPPETMPGWLRAFVTVNPVSHVVTAVRDLANTGHVTAEVGWAVLACVVLAVVFGTLATRAYGRRV